MTVRIILLVVAAVFMTGCPTPDKHLLPVDSPLLKWEQTEMVEQMPERAKKKRTKAAAPKGSKKAK